MKRFKYVCIKYRYVFLFIVLLGLCSLFPYTGDDWAWGSSIGIEHLESWFHNYNGRYIGNLIVLALTRSHILRIVSMSFCLTGIVFCMEKMIGERWVFAVGCLLLIAMPKLVFRQAVVWTAGFSNYATSIFFILIYVVNIRWIFYPKGQAENHLKAKPIPAALLFILSAMTSMIVEHITIYNVVLGFGVLVYVFIKYRKILIQHICYCMGGVLGAFCMFSNTAYHSIAENEDTYRTIASNGLLFRIKENYVEVIYSELYMQNLALNALMVAVCIALFFSLKNKIKNKRISRTLLACLCAIAGYFVWSVFSIVCLSDEAKPYRLLYLEAFGTIIGAVSLIVFSLLISTMYNKLEKMLFYIGSVLCLTAPLFVVTPIGSRCFFATYVFLALLSMELLKMLLETHYERKSLVEAIQLSGLLGCCIGLVFYSCVYGSIHRVDVSRLEHVREKVSNGEKEVELIHYPFESFLWCATPDESTDIWATRYKLFYEIPEEIELIPVYQYSSTEK